MKQRILIVDDEPFILSQMSRGLYHICGFRGEIETVENGSDAIKAITCCFYNICFLDIGLPDINGLEVMKKISELSPDTVIVIMSGSYITGEMQEAIDKYGMMFLEKPFEFAQIQEIMCSELFTGGVLSVSSNRKMDQKVRPAYLT